MTLRAPAVVPPIVLFAAPLSITTPEYALRRAFVPVTSVPMKLSWTTTPVCPSTGDVDAITRRWPRSRCQRRLPSRRWYCSPRLRRSRRRSTCFPGRFVTGDVGADEIVLDDDPGGPSVLIQMPFSPLAEITLPASAVVPPMVVFVAPLSISTPWSVFPRRFVPVTSVPMRLCWTTTPVVPAPVIKMPSSRLAEITLPAPAVVPPMVLFAAPPAIPTPEYAFPRAFVPVRSVPMKLCWTTTPVVPASVIQMPFSPLAEITLPASAVVPPMVVFAAPPSICDAGVRVSQGLRTGDVGADEIVLDDDPGGPAPVIQMPPSSLAEITLPAPAVVPPMVVFTALPSISTPAYVFPRALRTGDVGADEIVLDDDPGGPSAGDPDAVLRRWPRSRCQRRLWSRRW